ncbi:protein LEKR1 [Heteronotia binoei]|uniref:protein LEKR1 n=1 Tax=Heteronotia binoei TaxID=13085 RepID=UPI00292F0F68|nr:protein LEKR1 [Heteronotia binoei]
MDRHVPVHPLPEELQKMSRDETVCKYCGVSYLILHEFKMLEEKVKAMEEKVKFYEGSVERENQLQEKLQRLGQDLDQCTAACESKTERIKQLHLELEQKQDAIQNLHKQLRCFQIEKEASHRQVQLLRKTEEQHQSVLTKASALLPFIRGELKGFKADLFGSLHKWTALKGQIFLQLKNVNTTALAEISSLNQSLAKCQRENVLLQEEVKQSRLRSEVAEAEIKQLRASVLQGGELQNRCHELQKKTQDLTSQVETTERKLQKAAAEMGYYKELFTKASKEGQDYQSELQKLQSDIRRSESRFTNTLKEQEQSLFACQKVCKRLQEKVVEKEREEEGLRKRTSHLESELETIKNHLRQREEEVVMLKQERESHQNRMKQLQETLRQKVMKEKNWQEKIEADREKEQAHYTEEILRIKEDAGMELDIEKQKHQELIAKYQRDQDELLHKKVLLQSAVNNLEMEMGTLGKQLHEAQTKLSEKNNKAGERQSLEKRLADLEIQLSEEQSTHHAVTEDMAEEIKKKSYDLEKLTQEQTQLIQKLNEVQEENALLQDTVRRECEERFELTEALTQAREQVMELKKLSGNFPLPQCSLSQGNLTSSAGSVNGHSQKSSDRGRGRTPPGLCGISRATKVPSCSWYKSSNVSAPGLPALQPSRRRVSSLDESRRRIAATITRQLSQQ